MSYEGLSRRAMVAASFGAAALPLAACSPTPPQTRVENTAARQAVDARSARNVRDFGAVGDGTADDTEAIGRAAAAGGGPVVLYLPVGEYRVTAWPELPDFSTVVGDGGDVSTIVHTGDGTLIALRGKQRVSFTRLGVYVVRPTASAVSLSGSFRCSFDSVVLRGGHLSDNYPQFSQQRGVILDENTGGTAFVNCDINNFGIGIVTSCIQNYLTSSKLTNNYVGVLGTGNDHNAGLALTNVEFVSDVDPKTTDQHIRVDGAANNWWLTNVWFEGADIAVSIGDLGRGGPAQFGMVNCKVAARSVCVDLIYCRQPYLADVQFGRDLAQPPAELRIDPGGCPEGTAMNLISMAAYDLDPRSFPAGWNVTGRGIRSGGAFVAPLVTRAWSPGTDLLQAQAPDGSPLSAILPSGAWLSDRADGGVILKDPAGQYWRLSVSTEGRVETTPLGGGRPPA
ncbi:glycosyl hydrolase family 28-related protein [Actinomycetospora callitridis]|uniref:glycosyl hydrolase family 28-related protein n=1 Tax=Actinomycetospora callitridis TaxID=913944 RepID=UPI0023671824|nr:glycosyl hydrolase family 28-related protein [Actinomycetospora callitridis]MDD7917610.1 glycosyl hydrolase family 28-related protein [Actinomycetospora callitridis]